MSVLAFASYTDWQWRRAPNVLWWILAGIGAALIIAEAILDWRGTIARWPYLVGIPVLVLLIYVLWYFGLIAGGADAKALMAIAVLAPFPIALADNAPPLATPLPGGFVVLTNSLLAFMLIPIGMLLWNLAHGDLRMPHAFLGVKRVAAHVRRGHAWPMEVVAEDGTRRTKLFASRMTEEEIDAAFARVQALGDERVWITLKIPFMIPLLLGFVLSFGAGDLLTALVMHLVPARH